MQQLQLSIALGDGQTIYAQPGPEDQGRLAELLGDRSQVELAANDAEVEGHSISGDVIVDVEGHAIAIRLPNGDDAARLRRALAVGTVTAAIVGAGAIAALQSPPAAPTTVVPAPAPQITQAVPAPALRAQDAEMVRQQSQPVAIPGTVSGQAEDVEIMTQGRLQAIPGTVSGQAEDVEIMTQGRLQSIPGTADQDGPQVPAQAQNAQDAELSGQ